MMKGFYFPKNFWRGLLFILLAYTVVQLLVYQHLFVFDEYIALFRQPIRWLTITFVYMVGARMLKSTDELWLLTIWHFVHITLIGYLLIVSFFEYFVRAVPYGIRASVAPIIEFLISPVLYMCAGLIFHTIESGKQK